MAVQSVPGTAPGTPADARPGPDAVGPGAERRARSVLDQLLGDDARDAAVEPLAGGLTNDNYVVRPAAGPVLVLRIPTASDSALGIDRGAELRNARIAAARDVAPEVVAASPGGASLVRYVPGRTLTADDLDDSGTLERVAALCRDLHAGPRFVTDFDMFAVRRRYLATVSRRGLRLPDDYADHEGTLERIHTALAASRAPTVACHNDLLAANILDDGRLWFVDWEYSGNNDAAFELGNLWAEADLAEDRLGELVEYYAGTASPALAARARLLAAVGQYGWTLWAAIQQAVSSVDVDFGAWGRHRYDRAVALFRSARLTDLLDTAAHAA